MIAVVPCVLILAGPSWSQQPAAEKPDSASTTGPAKSSYDQVQPVLLGQETFETQDGQGQGRKGQVMARQKALLEERYDLSVKTDPTVKMTRGKPIPVGPATKLPQGVTWDMLAKMSPDDIRAQGSFRRGSCRFRTRSIWSAAWSFLKTRSSSAAAGAIRYRLRSARPFLGRVPAGHFLTTRPDLGDVSQGKVLTVENFQLVFGGILNAKDLKGCACW